MSVIAFEGVWLRRNAKLSGIRATVFAITTNIGGLGIGLLMAFALVALMLMLAFGPDGEGSQTSETTYRVLLASALIVPLLTLAGAKRLGLLAANPSGIASPNKYAFCSSLIILLGISVPPVIALYILLQVFS